MTTFEQLWTVETVQAILKEFTTHESSYLCIASQLFCHLWHHYRNSLITLAFDFSPKERIEDPQCYRNCLFYLGNAKQIRIDFLNHEIARLAKQNKTNLG